jgi:hypothetical protein
MTFSPLRRYDPGFSAPQAYSDDGACRKQGGGRPAPPRKGACKPRANCLNPKEIRKKPHALQRGGVLTCSHP